VREVMGMIVREVMHDSSDSTQGEIDLSTIEGKEGGYIVFE
jgi:hypothetical protein